MTELRGERVVLRAFREDEFDRIWDQWKGTRAHPRGARQRALGRMRHSGEFHDGWLDLAIEVDGRLAGDIQARRPKGALPPGVYELGISFFDVGDRARGLGSEAVRLLTGHLFAETDAGRVQASTGLENQAMRRVLEKLGFREEGILRGFMANDAGGRDDYVLYAVTREDWEG